MSWFWWLVRRLSSTPHGLPQDTYLSLFVEWPLTASDWRQQSRSHHATVTLPWSLHHPFCSAFLGAQGSSIHPGQGLHQNGNTSRWRPLGASHGLATVKLCVWVLHACMCWCVCLGMWRPEVNVSCLSLTLSNLLFLEIYFCLSF